MSRFRACFKCWVTVMMLNAFLFASVWNFRKRFSVDLLEVRDVVINQTRMRIYRGGHPGKWIVGARSGARQDAPEVGRGCVAFGQRREAEALFDGLEHRGVVEWRRRGAAALSHPVHGAS